MSTAEPAGAIEVAPIEDTSLLAFYRDMNLPERRTFWACAAGWTLDGMDFMIYPLVIGTIITLWKVDPGSAGLGRHGDAAGVRGRRLARRLSRRSHRPGQDAAAHHPLVLVLLAALRLRAEFRSVDRCARAARPRLRRRMGRGRGADGRSDPRAISRPRGRLRAVGLGRRLGPCGAVAGDHVLVPAARTRLALDVRDRRAAGADGVLSAPLRHRAGDRRHDACQPDRLGRRGRRWGRFFPDRSSRPRSWHR